MNVSFLSIARTVLFMTDELLYIYKSSSKGVELIDSVSWEAENFSSNVANTIRRKCGEKPILIINDMVEQHYRKERVIKTGVSILDRKNMVTRKINMAFPGYPFRAALPLKEKVKDQGKIAADIYIFAAVPETAQSTKTINVAKEALSPISGLCFLPIESSDMVQALASKLCGKTKKQGKWTLFMGQHRSGGLRQIVTKDGELALTRISPITEDSSNTKLWSDEVLQEYKATMSYLSRFGYQQEDGLDVILISDSDAGHLLDSQIDDDINFYHMGASEAAKELGINIGMQENQVYADSLHVGWIARKASFALPMKSKQLDKISQPRQIAFWGSVALAGCILFQMYQMTSGWSELNSLNSKYNEIHSQESQLDVQHKQEVKRKEDLGFDLVLIQAALITDKELEDSSMEVLEFFASLGEALGKDLHLSYIELEQPQPPKQDIYGYGNQKPLRSFVSNIEMTYPSTVDLIKGNEEVNRLRDRIAALLPESTVNVTKLLKDYVYVEEMTVETGDTGQAAREQDYIAEISIKGPEKQ